MMMSERTSPDAGGAGAWGVDEIGPWKPVDPQANTPLPTELQAARLRSRFRLSLPLALATAELAFASGRPA